jgi:hypothetical protein
MVYSEQMALAAKSCEEANIENKPHSVIREEPTSAPAAKAPREMDRPHRRYNASRLTKGINA